ncbi:type III secretion system export apparatus subunit SctU [Bordetella bronchialis]|uniref:EscU/YscU/HrcU family type III secretion system export apparatus switch protein n=1 Tax=Bordetella bronchialis TaxID=463025 RepID=A0A193FKK4_9BORD|nr:type III secretion system export apparatus subunit SctU [Bordetella bronchialis]ANN68287.1 EscU/YscU/HrcU family type III secretion system export apparatus switch protein [Bordetella bronchialis]ANN73427.1 EscU/YscU/HrcU family type III secretion system export apparatus switch protein [Bordetella bronchialis]
MSGEKSEKPTPKKLQDARKKGDVPYSRDFSQTLLTLALSAYVVLNSQNILSAFLRILAIPAAVAGLAFQQALKAAGSIALHEALGLLGPFVLIVLGFGFFVEFSQIGLIIAPEKAKPSGTKLNVVSNVKNIFSAKNLVEVLKSTAKIVCFAVLTWLLLREGLNPLVHAVHGGLEGVMQVNGSLFRLLLLYTAIFCLAIAGLDLGWQRHQRHKRLMMTKEEVKREQKDNEGQPEIKQQRKRLHQELGNGGAVEAVRKSSTLVVNPTHVAVALRYVPDETPLPIVVAKGRDGVALQMIAMAERIGIPVMRDVPLARALLADARENEYIPSELVVPVAHVLRAVRDLAMEDRESPPGSL